MQALLDRFSARVLEVDGALANAAAISTVLSCASAARKRTLPRSLTAPSPISARARTQLKEIADDEREAKRGTDAIAAQLAETAARYEAATHHLGTVSKPTPRSFAPPRMKSRNNSSSSTPASSLATSRQEVQARAAVALQNLQQVLERLLSTRDATQSVGETLTASLKPPRSQRTLIAASTRRRKLPSMRSVLRRKRWGVRNKIWLDRPVIRNPRCAPRFNNCRSVRRRRKDHARTERSALGHAFDVRESSIARTAVCKASPTTRRRRFKSCRSNRQQAAAQGPKRWTAMATTCKANSNAYSYSTQGRNMGQEVGRMTSDTLTAIEI